MLKFICLLFCSLVGVLAGDSEPIDLVLASSEPVELASISPRRRQPASFSPRRRQPASFSPPRRRQPASFSPPRRRRQASSSPVRRRAASSGGYSGNSGSVKETTRTSAGDEVKNAFTDVLLGIVLVCLAFPCLYYNEKRQVHMEKIFAYAEPRIKDVSAESVDVDNEAAIVCVQGDSSTGEILRDAQLKVEVQNCAKLERRVEMWQWSQTESSETRDTSDGGKETTKTYSYSEGWEGHAINSNEFKNPNGHENPPFPSVKTAGWTAKDVVLGAFTLDESLIGQMGNWSPAEVQPQSIDGKMLQVQAMGVIQSSNAHGGGVPAGSFRGGFSGPVNEDVAQRFLSALRSEYVNKQGGGAVGEFFDSINGGDVERLDPFESRVRDAGHRGAEEIQSIAREWGVGAAQAHGGAAQAHGGSSARIGEVRITMKKVECGPCSVASIQSGMSFQPLTYAMVPDGGCCGTAPDKVDLKTAQLNPGGGDVEIQGACSCVGALIESGECIHNLYESRKSGKQIVAIMKRNQGCLHTALQVCGFLMFVFGNQMIFKFGGSIFRFIPFIGTWIESLWKALAFVAALLCACQCWLVTVAVSWLALRPMKGILMLVVAGGSFAAMNIASESMQGS